ncbi:MAG TPA: CPBP family intramembrane glutamic endopeptidase, partial [Sphingomonadales bacterium]|nr:CPBP family intramembrane glutamic endopeptidase [Sphingomonadales bacterium]
VLIIFPAVLVFVVPEFEFMRAFYRGDRSLWLAFWGTAALIEWGTLALVLATFREKLGALREVGFPLTPVRREKIVGGAVLGFFIVLAIAGAGTPQDFLPNVPEGARMFVPPADLSSRLFWVFMALTAAIVEETLWRGMVLTELKKLNWHPVLAVAASSLSFAYFHGGHYQDPGTFAMRFFAGVAFSALYLKTKSLKWPILIHFLLDAALLAAIQYS